MSTPATSDDLVLLKQTLRMMAILVGSLVVFMGMLSLVAVLVTTKAFGTTAPTKADNTEATATKKPLSI
jgi:hypothetical protein